LVPLKRLSRQGQRETASGGKRSSRPRDTGSESKALRNSAAHNPTRKTMALVGARIRNIRYHCVISNRLIPLLSVSMRAQPNWLAALRFASVPQMIIRVMHSTVQAPERHLL